MCFELIGAAHDKTAAVLPPPDQQRRLSTFRRCRRRGGLRIGKPHSEGHLDGDGQYFHYLTKWAFALDRMSLACGDPKYHRWAVQVRPPPPPPPRGSQLHRIEHCARCGLADPTPPCN